MKSCKFLVLLIFLTTGWVSGQEVKLMTYNVKYANENDGENSWSYRKDWLTNQINFYAPDLLGVQEAVYDQIVHFKNNIKAYAYIGEGRDGGESGEFSAIFYNKEKFEVLEQQTFWLSENPDEISKGWDAALNRICTYGLFQDRRSLKKFWVFNTHFDHVGEVARTESSGLIIEKIKELNKDKLPVVLMGDLNLEPDSNGIGLITDYLIDSEEIAELRYGPSGTFNAFKFHEPVTRRIDYIFVNDKVKVLKYAVLSDSKDLRYPSDHFPVMIEALLLN